MMMTVLEVMMEAGGGKTTAEGGSAGSLPLPLSPR